MSEINYGQLRSVTARRLVAALERDGFELRRQSGSHRHYKRADGRRVTVSFHHSSETFPPKTLRSMVETQAGWSVEDLQRLGLV